MEYTIDLVLSKRYRTPVILTKLPLRELIDDELEWQKRDLKLQRVEPKSHYPFYRLRPIHSYVLLQQLAASGKLFSSSKKIIGDFFSRLKLEYLAEQKENLYYVHAQLNNRSLSDYDLILQGSPHIALLGQMLRFIDPNVAWLELSPFLDGPKAMTKAEYLAFKESIDPNLLIEFLQEEKPTVPTLTLVDATCSFAKLEKEFLAYEEELVKAGFSKKMVGISNYYCPTDKSPAAIKTLIEKGWRVVDAAGNAIVLLTNQELELDKGFHVTGTVSFGTLTVPIERIVGHVKRSSRLFNLEGNKTGLLVMEPAVEELLLSVELIANSLTLPKKNLIAFQPFVKEATLASCFRIGGAKEYLPAPGFIATLRPYQQEGLNWLMGLYECGLNGLLADEMGLGKTVQVIAFLSRTAGPTLIVVPTSLLYNWQREIEHFLPQKSHAIYHGPDRKLAANDITITSYGTLRTDIDLFKAIFYDALILDEAQAIKNSSTITSQSIMQLQSRFRLSLTGTPVENSVSELLTHFHFLEPGLVDETTALPSLKKKIAPFLLRRKKSEVAKDLPEKVDESVFVTMQDEQKSLYDRFLLSLKAGLLKKVAADGIKAHRLEVFEAILRLRQIACHPLLVPQLVEALAPDALSSCKYDLVLEDIETLVAEGKKVLLFSQFTSMLQLIAKGVTERGIPHLMLDGTTKNRQGLVDTFQTDPNAPLFLVSLKAGGVGLNLTAADYVLLYDPWWNRAQEAQAVDRAHRIGRTGTVFCKRYYVQGSIEEKILALQEKKSKLIESLLDGESSDLIGPDELYELIDWGDSFKKL